MPLYHSNSLSLQDGQALLTKLFDSDHKIPNELQKITKKTHENMFQTLFLHGSVQKTFFKSCFDMLASQTHQNDHANFAYETHTQIQF